MVFTRPGYDLAEINEQKKKIEEKYNADIIFLNMPVIDISSTTIKKKKLVKIRM